MFKVNDNYLKLPGSYLFSTIGKKVHAFQEANPDKKVIRLGIGDVTQPIAPAIIDTLHHAVDEMGNAGTFRGYAPDLGYDFCGTQLRRMIIKAAVVISQQMKFLSRTVQNATAVIFRRFSARIIKLLYVTRFIPFMWIPMSWQEEQGSITL